MKIDNGGGAMDVIMAIQACKKAELKWSKTSLEKRQELLGRAASFIRSQANTWSEAESKATGLPTELLLEQCYLYGAQVFEEGASRSSPSDGPIVRGPVGTCAIFLPWVLGFRVFAERIVPALLYGNTVIIKVSEKNPLVGQHIVECLNELFSESVVTVLGGLGSEVGPILAGHPAIAAVDFVGRYETAESLLGAASRMGKRLRFLAGAKNSAVVLDDCDFSEVIPEILRSAFTGQGQLAQNISRVFVSQKRHKEFIEALESAINENPSFLSPLRLINEEAEVDFQKSLKEILGEGGKLIEGPGDPERSPKVIYDLTMCSPFQQDEVHGPLLLVNEYKYLHEAEKWVNTGYHGHAAQIWAKDLDKAKKLAGKLQVGTVWLNQWFDRAGEASFVQRASGYGAYSPGGADEFFSTFTRILG